MRKKKVMDAYSKGSVLKKKTNKKIELLYKNINIKHRIVKHGEYGNDDLNRPHKKHRIEIGEIDSKEKL